MFEEKIKTKAANTQINYRTVLNNWEKFCELKFGNHDIITELLHAPENTTWIPFNSGLTGILKTKLILR